MKRLVFVAMLIVLGALVLGWRYYPPAAGWLLVTMGKSPACGASAYTGIYRRFAYDVALKRIASSARRVRVDGNLKLTETSQGQYWEPGTDDSMVVAQLAELDSKYGGGNRHPVHKGEIVIDCGANVGTWAASALNAGAKLVVAVEPDPTHLECLRRNLQSGIAEGRVLVIPKGVWSHEDTLVLRKSEETSAKNSFVETTNTRPGLTLSVTTVDNIVQQLRLARVDFIKMDIEGSEPRALAGAVSTLSRWQPRMELEVSDLNQAELLSAARKGWSGYRSECLVCVANGELKQIVPSLITLGK